MIIPNYAKLYEPYTTDGATLDGSIKWIIKTTGCDKDVADLVVSETMMEIADGKDFFDPCPCGCGFTRAHSHIEHYMAAKALELKNHTETLISDFFQQRERARILAHIATDNKQYTESKLKPSRVIQTWNKIFKPNGEYFTK